MSLTLFIGIIFGCFLVPVFNKEEAIRSLTLRFIEKGPHTFYSGNQTKVLCVVNGGQPQPDINWYLNSQTFDSGDSLSVYKIDTVLATNQFQLDGHMDGKNLICEAKNKLNSRRANLTLNVKYSPFVTVSYESEAGRLACQATGNPAQYSLPGWVYKHGNLSIPLQSNRISSSNPWYLDLSAGSLNDTGLYTCSVSNGIGNPGTAEYFVQTKIPPMFLKPVMVYTTMEQSNLSVSFDVYSWPAINRYQLQKDHTDLDFPVLFVNVNVTLHVRGIPMELPGQKVVLEMTNLNSSQSGNYSLRLTTSMGDYKTVDFQIMVAEPVKSTPSLPVVYKGGLGAGIIVLIVVIIINVIAFLAIVYWRYSRTKRKGKSSRAFPEKSRFLPEKANNSNEAPIPPKRTSSARRVKPKTDYNDYTNHYAELDFGAVEKKNKSVIRKEPPTEYAWIDFSRSPGKVDQS